MRPVVRQPACMMGQTTSRPTVSVPLRLFQPMPDQPYSARRWALEVVDVYQDPVLATGFTPRFSRTMTFASAAARF